MNQHVRKQVSSEKYFAEVERLIAARELQTAAQRLNAVAHAAQADPRLHMLGMQLAEAAGNHKAALESARRAVSHAPEWAPATLNLALLLGRLNEYPEALAEADRAVALAPSAIAVLRGAIEIAQRVGDLPRSLRWLEAALQIEPDNLDHRLRFAVALSMSGAHAQALDALDKLVSEAASGTTARETRALARALAGDSTGAVEDWDFLLEQSPANPVWQYRRNVASGNVPAAAPAELVAAMFDNMADVYDMQQLRAARYRLPKDVADRIVQLHPDRKLNVLDLGCGTGLLGVMLQRIDGALVGVDASLKMMEKAAAHKVYAKFHHVNLLDALEATPESLYEVITVLDVFTYIGDLSDAIPNASRVLTPGGHLFFSCELLPEDADEDWTLLSSGHYAQKRSYVHELCVDAGLDPVIIQELTLRHEGGHLITGILVEATKPERNTARPRKSAAKDKAQGPTGTAP